MTIDFGILNGPRSGRSFVFIPCHDTDPDTRDTDYLGPHVFSVREEAFLFIERFVAISFPDWWKNYHHWGITWVCREIWIEILAQFSDLRKDAKDNMPLQALVSKYASCPGLLPRKTKFNRKILIRFLDQFEARIRSLIERYPYVLIWGI